MAPGGWTTQLLPELAATLTTRRTHVTYCRAGRLFTRLRDRYVEKGTVVAKLTAAHPSRTWWDQPLDD